MRVNGADLRRGIVEPSDVIELGDVQFKFVGAGQIYRATDSQKLAALTDRQASDIVRGRKPSNALPIAIFAAVVVAGTLGAWAYTRRDSEMHGSAGSTTAAAPSPERAALDDAKALCASGDCEGAHKKIEAALADGSPLRASPDFKDLVGKWADQLIARADAETDTSTRVAMYQRVSQAMDLDPARRKTAADKVQQLEAVADAIPSAAAPAAPAAKPRAEDSVSATPHPEGNRRQPVAFASDVTAAPPPQAAAPAPAPSPAPSPKPSAMSVDDRERALALQGTQDSKVLLKRQLEQRVNNGKASDSEIRLLIGTCKDLGDRACVQAAREALAQKQQ